MKNIKKILIVSIIFFLASVFIIGNEEVNSFGYFPQNGFVPDETTAKSIAEAVWIPIYGKKIKKNKPYIAKLENGIWYVNGSAPKPIFFDSAGGEPYIEINKMTGEIVKVYHSK